MTKIYFARAGSDGPIKIGSTCGDPYRRIARLQTGCPDRINLLGAVDCEPHHERALHQVFLRERLSGEWFRPTDRLLSAIEQVIARTYEWPANTAPSAPINSAMEEACENVGGQTALAERLGISQSQIWYWLTKAKKGAAAEYVLKIEAATGVPRHKLRPDVYPLAEVAA